MSDRETLVRLGLDQLSEGFGIFDGDLRLVSCNRLYRQLRDYPSELCQPGTPFEQMIRFNAERGDFGPGSADQQVAERMAEIADADQREIEREMANGQILNIRYQQLEGSGLIVTFQDKTEERRAQNALAQSEKRLLDSLDTISDGFLLVDSRDNVQLWNRRYLEIFGGAADGDISDIVQAGIPFLDMIRDGYERGMFKPHPKGVEGWIAVRRAARQSLSAELEMQLSNGQWLLINERAMSDGGRVSVYTDITEFKRREDELEAARARFEDAIEALSSGFVLFGSDDRIVVCNTKYRDYFPELRDMVTPGTPFVEVIRAGVERGMFPASLDNREDWLAALLEQRSKASGTREQHLESGLWLQVSDHRTSDGGIVSIYTDVTELKRREIDLIAARDEAERALSDLKLAQERLIQAEKMASLGQLTAGIAHEIKNPLNFVNNFAKLSAEMLDELAGVLKEPIRMLDEDDRDDAEDLIETVRSNLLKIDEHGKRADSIVKNMLQHSREGSGVRQIIDLNALVLEAMNLAYHGARAADTSFNVDLVTELADDVDKVEGLAQELQRVILNLCSNGMYAAVKRAAEGGEPARLTVTSRRANGGYLVEVTDNGGGIPDDIRDKVFQPFFTTKPTGEGTGLGLSMSYDIVKQHGGDLTLASTLGSGATFCVQLPKTDKTSVEG